MRSVMRSNTAAGARRAIAVALLLAASTPALAGDHGSMEDQMACTPDVYRLCSSYVPNEDAITACLRRNLQILSPACNRVFTRPDTPAAANDGDE